MEIHLEFYPTSITKKVIDDRTEIKIYGRDKNGKKYCLEDSYEPSFLVLPKDNVDYSLEQLKQVEHKGIKPTNCRIKKVLFSNKEKKVIEIFASNPKHIPVLRKHIELLDLGIIFEDDIITRRKYVYDKKVKFLSAHSVIGELEPRPTDSKCDVIKLIEIKELDSPGVYQPSILALNIETYSPLGKTNIPSKDPIVMISFASKDYRKVLTWKHFKSSQKNIEIVSSEEALITRTKEIIDHLQPDVVVGYNSDSFDFPYLCERAKKYNLEFNIGTDYTEVNMTKNDAIVTGITHIDLYKLAKYLLKSKTSKLSEFIDEFIPDNNRRAQFSDLVKLWNKADIEHLCEHILTDTEYTYIICKHLLMFLTTIVNFIGLPLFDISRMTPRQIAEWYLIKAAKEENVVIPSKPTVEESRTRISNIREAKIFIDEKKGLHQNVGLLSFESLFPAMIVSYNISSDTLVTKREDDPKDLIFDDENKGFIPKVLEELMLRLFRVRDIEKKVVEHEKKVVLKNRIAVLKMIINAFYLTYSHSRSRWYNYKLYEAITFHGEKYIKRIIDLVHDSNHEIMYADTKDLYLIQTPNIRNDSKNLINEINKKLPGIMELDLKAVFDRVLCIDNDELVLMRDSEIIHEGVDNHTTDFCYYAKNARFNICKSILQTGSIENALSYIRRLIQDLRTNKVNMDDLIVYRVLSRNVDSYTENRPHVSVAKQMLSKGYLVGPGSVIKYVVLKGDKELHERVRIPKEVRIENIDQKYYIESQLIPSVLNIFELFGIKKSELLISQYQSDLSDYS